MRLDSKNYTNLLSCHGTPAADTPNGSCNPYKGDTWCMKKKPILCIHKSSIPRPPTYVSSGVCGAMPCPFYYGWSQGITKITDPIRGC